MIRKRLTLILPLAILLGSPVVAYEGLQKSAEHFGVHMSAQRLSTLAELGTPWRPATGSPLLDHTLHEFQEVRLFLRLSARALATGRA